MLKEDKEVIRFTLVYHQARRKLSLSLNEYCIADSIYNLSNNPNSEIKGWCYASKETLGDYLDISAWSVWDILKRLIDKGLVEKNINDRRYLRTTQKWYDNVVLLRVKSRSKETQDILGKPKIGSGETQDSIQ